MNNDMEGDRAPEQLRRHLEGVANAGDDADIIRVPRASMVRQTDDCSTQKIVLLRRPTPCRGSAQLRC